jgi:transcriptional regulator with GAF, ATPase, and Fis domain
VKPANIMRANSGEVTFVDLGLATAWREGGAQVEGLTPRYAAPELLMGRPLTVRAEVYALGVILADLLELVQPLQYQPLPLVALQAIVDRATADEPAERQPSADEFASGLKSALGERSTESGHNAAAYWPIVGMEPTIQNLLHEIAELAPGGTLRVVGPPGSGRSALLRRTAWSLGIDGDRVVYLDETCADRPGVVREELFEHSRLYGVTVLVDDADMLDAADHRELAEARKAGARLVIVGRGGVEADARNWPVPPLEVHAARSLVHRAVPSLTERMLDTVVEASGCRAGELRRLVRLIDQHAIASQTDLERLIKSQDILADLPDDPLSAARYLLDHGRYIDAKAKLAELEKRPTLEYRVLQARLNIGLADADSALRVLLEGESLLAQTEDRELVASWHVFVARARLGLGEYQTAIEIVEALPDCSEELRAEAEAYRGLGLERLGQTERATLVLRAALGRLEGRAAPRVRSLVLTCLALALQRADQPIQAQQALEAGIVAAETAGDAGALATLQLNLAGLLKVRGELARAIEHFEAAVDLGRRSGRRHTMQHALLNLANTDLYLGRLARAQSSIETLQAQESQLSPELKAELMGRRAELEAQLGHHDAAARLYKSCAEAYRALGRPIDAVEAELEGVLIAAQAEAADFSALSTSVEAASAALEGSQAHRALRALAAARVARGVGDEPKARELLAEATQAARDTSQLEWLWKALEVRAEIYDADGQSLLARRDREEALATLEEVGARLPRDLREVYWNDARRRQLRGLVESGVGRAATEHSPVNLAPMSRKATTKGVLSVSTLTVTPLEQRLARILEINAELAGVVDLERLTERVVDHSVDLLHAERGYLILVDERGLLSVHTSRVKDGDDAHAEFSRSIAESVIRTREPMISVNADSDSRLRSYASVHQLMLKSVACVPIRAPRGRAIGALYLETRLGPGAHFAQELPTLSAFADQVAVALENARLLRENQARAEQLAATNLELEAAHERLQELLGDRTQKLKAARRQLRDVRDTLMGHFGYKGLVGTSTVMRRVYALIDRVKDTDLPILITGESGTGKEVVARVVHEASPRSKQKFLGVNCGAIPEHLLESELFGHLKGAFTGADRDRKGLFREAEGGSILLDEIGETPSKMQTGLLRVLQERKLRPVGGVQEQDVDVRVIFATNRDLKQLVDQGTFREDLYYRIHVVELHLPPLRERIEDIPQLVDHFFGIFAARYKREKKVLTRAAQHRLASYPWPGNVRQLENVLLNAWVLSEDNEVDADDLDLPIKSTKPSVAPAQPPPSQKPASSGRTPAAPSKKETLSQHRRDERERILSALKACNWNRVRAAELSGIPRRTFYRRLRKYGIQ